MAIESRGYSKAFQAAASTTRERRATPADAFEAARQTFLEGRRVEMSDLATLLGVSRTTIYNWCGDRDQLLVDVLWSVAEPVSRAAWNTHASSRGSGRVLATCEDIFEAFASGEPLRAFLQNETHAALRLLTGRSGLHDRLVELYAELIGEEVRRGELRLQVEPEILADALVRTIESCLYNDAIAAVEPQAERASEISALLLNGAETRRR